MIYSLSGKIVETGENFVVLEAGGVGYGVFVPVSLLAGLTGKTGPARLHTVLISGEAGMDLYGFETREERELFNLLRSVSGVGPRVSLKIMGLPKGQVAEAIVSDDHRALMRVDGVGKKIAQRLILELREKMGKSYVENYAKGAAARTAGGEEMETALRGLQSLGYGPGEIQGVLRKLDPEKIKGLTAEQIIRECLKRTGE